MSEFDLDEYPAGTQQPNTAVAPPPQPQPTQPSYQPTYVRPSKPRRTQAAIDNLEEDSAAPSHRGGYTHDSNITVRGGMPFSSSPYRKSRADIGKLQRGSRYGQYLEIPKGKRSIFVSRERARRRNSVIIMILIIALIVLVVAFAIQLIMNSAG